MHEQAAPGFGNPSYLAIAFHSDAMTTKRVFDDAAKARIHSRKNGFRATDQRNFHSAMCESVRHFETDVSGTNNHRRLRVLSFEIPMHAKAVSHCVKWKHAGPIDARNAGYNRASSSCK